MTLMSKDELAAIQRIKDRKAREEAAGEKAAPSSGSTGPSPSGRTATPSRPAAPDPFGARSHEPPRGSGAPAGMGPDPFGNRRAAFGPEAFETECVEIRTMGSASIGSRFAALMLDGFFQFLALILMAIFARTAGFSKTAFNVLGALACFAYAALLEGIFQATWGKMIMGIRVIQPDGDDISQGQACLRTFVKQFLSPIFFVGFLMAFANEEHETLHDKAAGTRVVKRRL